MASEFEVRAVSLQGAPVPHSWRFPSGVTVIVGDSGGGKTSLLNLIKYGLGGEAPITSTLKEAADGVVVEVRAGSRNFLLHRSFHSRKSVVSVSEGEKPLGQFSTKNGQSRPWISSLLLNALDIPEVRVPASRSKSSHRLTTISFQDVFAYCYLDQDAIDQETVNDKQSYGAGAKRPWTFELLHGIVDSEVAALEVEREELASETEDRQQRLASVERFVETVELPSSAMELREQLGRLDLRERELQQHLDTVEREAQEALAEDDAQRYLRGQGEEELREARVALAQLKEELSEVRRAGNQIERDLETAREGEAARLLLEPLPYLVCPRCEQSLEDRETRTGHCVVCQQSEQGAEAADDLLRHRLGEQLEETRALAGQLENAVADAGRHLDELRRINLERREAFATAKDAATAPFRSAALRLQEELGALRGERRTLSAGLPIEQAVQTERVQIESSAPRMNELADEAQRRREALEPARERVEEVSILFSEILHEFSLPWLKNAEVARNTYLPLVNGLSLRNLSSGGMKTTTNVAYYLAVFVTGLRDREVLTPSFLMLDSIRKDSGSGFQDLARSDRIYSYLRTLQELRGGGPQALARNFQLLVVDNDLPSKFEREFHTLRIDPESPLVRGMD